MLLTKPLYRDASSAVVEITRRTRKGKLKTKGLLLMQAGGERMFALSGTQFSTQFTCFTAANANAGRRRAHVQFTCFTGTRVQILTLCEPPALSGSDRQLRTDVTCCERGGGSSCCGGLVWDARETLLHAAVRVNHMNNVFSYNGPTLAKVL